MRCISRSYEFSMGICVVRSGEIYHVCMDNSGIVAFVSAESFNAMIARGHAVEEAPQVLQADKSWFGTLKTIIGGSRIFRCDFEMIDGAVWLIPERLENKDSPDMLVLAREHFEKTYIEPCVTPGATYVASAGEDHNDLIHLLKLTPGTGVHYTRSRFRPIPRKGLQHLNPFHVTKYKEEVTRHVEIFLHESGVLEY